MIKCETEIIKCVVCCHPILVASIGIYFTFTSEKPIKNVNLMKQVDVFDCDKTGFDLQCNNCLETMDEEM